MIVIPAGSVQKLNSYILQSSCRGGMQRVIRSDTAHSAHIHGYQHITIYVHSAFATNASLSILSIQPCMHPHTTLSPLMYTYALPAMYIHNYIRIAQSETLYTNDHLSLKRVTSITTSAKRNFTRSQKIVSLKNSTPCMWYIQYERILIPCMKNDKHVTIPRIIG